jgi:peptide/nickel transport system ATP-binding protein
MKDNHSDKVDTVNMVKLDPDGDAIRRIRGGRIGMIFQEPMSSLTPVYSAGYHIGEALYLHHLTPGKKIGDQIKESVQAHKTVSDKEARKIAVDMLHKVGLPKPQERVDNYPHQLSGGQRQRVMIAIALSCQPDLLIADEPTTALDVSIEAQILDLMRELQEELGMAIIFITHNLGVVAEMADEIVVMYMGKEVERASTIELFQNPKHPYTQALLKSIPRIGAKKDKLYAIQGMVPDPFNLPHGCVFHPRCPHKMPGKCDVVAPENGQVGEQHWTRCLLYDESWPQTGEAQELKMRDGGIPNELPAEV